MKKLLNGLKNWPKTPANSAKSKLKIGLEIKRMLCGGEGRQCVMIQNSLEGKEVKNDLLTYIIVKHI